MLLTALVVAAVAVAGGPAGSARTAPAAGVYVGRSSDHQLVKVRVRDGRVVRVDARARRFVCDPEGDVGPFPVTVRPNAPVVAGRFAFDVGPPPSRLRMTGRFGSRHTLRGTFRVRGTIGTGDPCVSPTRSFVATRKVAPATAP